MNRILYMSFVNVYYFFLCMTFYYFEIEFNWNGEWAWSAWKSRMNGCNQLANERFCIGKSVHENTHIFSPFSRRLFFRSNECWKNCETFSRNFHTWKKWWHIGKARKSLFAQSHNRRRNGISRGRFFIFHFFLLQFYLNDFHQHQLIHKGRLVVHLVFQKSCYAFSENL